MDLEVVIEPKEDFYDTYVDWSNEHSFPARNIDELDTVFVCYNGSTAIYSCFFWTTGSTFCVVGFPFSNPYADKEVKKGGLTFLLEEIAKTAQEWGYRIMWTTSSTPPVEKSLKEAGFIPADVKVDQYVKLLF